MATETDPKLALAILDAMFYAQSLIEPIRRHLDIHGAVDSMFEKAGRSAEVEREPAVRVNANIAAEFVDALADYGYTIIAAAGVQS